MVFIGNKITIFKGSIKKAHTMAKFSLIPFNKQLSPTIELTSEFNQNSESFFISYRIREGINVVDLGNGTPIKERVLKLWEKTCFELFIKNENNEYVEFNFSPVFEWNCFYFKQKGNPLAEYIPMQRPATEVLLSKDQFFIFIEIKKAYFPEGFLNGPMSVGISSVIKDKNKSLSYWALTHCDSRPNFHHFDSFIYKF